MTENLLLPELPESPMFVGSQEVMTIEWQEFFRLLFDRIGGVSSPNLDDIFMSLIAGLYSVPKDYGKRIDDLELILKSSIPPNILINYTEQFEKVIASNIFGAAVPLLTHKDSHDPEDGVDALDCVAPLEISIVIAASEGSAHNFARSDHIHAINHGITDNHIVTIDHAAAVAADYARFTASGLEGRSYAEVLADLSGDASATFNWNSQNLIGINDLDMAGDLDIVGEAAFGSAALTPLIGLYLAKIKNITSAGDNSYRKGLYTVLQVGKTGLANYTGAIIGIGTQVQLDDTNTQDWTNTLGIKGFDADINTEGSSVGTVTGIAGYSITANIQDAATVTNFYGYRLGLLQAFGNKLINAYGVYLSDVTAALTLNYAIYTNAGLVRFGDLVTFALGTEDLEIVDAGSAAATEQDWIQVKVGGNTGYIRVFAAK